MSNLKTVSCESNNGKECEHLWQLVQNNPDDFVSWTLLLQLCKHMTKIESIRKIYNNFLSHYPYCYIYWKQFSDYELQMSSESTAIDVLERAVNAFPISIDVWVYLIQHMIRFNKSDNQIMVSFESAIKLCGNDYNASDLWSLYLNWLTTRHQLSEVTLLYDRILQIPLKCLSQHFNNFVQFVDNHKPICILTAKQYQKYSNQYFDSLLNKDNKDLINCSANELNKLQDNSEESAAKIAFIRKVIVKERKRIFESTLKEVEERGYFEDNIKRPYFHVNPLDINQLDNWTKYLNWQIDRNTHSNIILIFERCLVSCALYEHMWVRYTNYLIEKRYKFIKTGKEFNEDLDINAIRSVFRRAAQIHTKKSFKIHNQWSLFEEREGNFTEALNILNKYESENPYLIEPIVSKIHLYHRRGDLNEVNSLFSTSIDKFKDYPKLCSHLSIRFSRFLFKVMKNTESAVNVLTDALKNDTNNYTIYLRLIDIEYQKQDLNVIKIEQLFDDMIANTQSLALKISMTQRKLEFMQDFGFSCQKIQSTVTRIQDLMYGFDDKTTDSDDSNANNFKKFKSMN